MYFQRLYNLQKARSFIHAAIRSLLCVPHRIRTSLISRTRDLSPPHFTLKTNNRCTVQSTVHMSAAPLKRSVNHRERALLRCLIKVMTSATLLPY